MATNADVLKSNAAAMAAYAEGIKSLGEGMKTLAGVTERLQNGHLDLAAGIKSINDLLLAKNTPAADPDAPWKTAVSTAMGKSWPEKLVFPLSDVSLLDPCVACDPHLMILIFCKTKVDAWIKDSVCPGEMMIRWRGLVSRDAVWLPAKAEGTTDGQYIVQTIARLESALLTLAGAFYRWPANEKPSTFLLEQSGHLAMCLDLCKELEGRNIKVRVGPKAAGEFFNSFRIGQRRTGATLSVSVGKIRSRKETGADETSDEDNDEDDKKSKKWKKKSKNDGKVSVDPTVAAPRRCNKCKAMVTVTWAAHKIASPTCT